VPDNRSHKAFVPLERGIASGSHVVLLVGGPFDGQDIMVSVEEWAKGRLVRNKCGYEARTHSAESPKEQPLLRQYFFTGSVPD
jgi:hypothetical protein